MKATDPHDPSSIAGGSNRIASWEIVHSSFGRLRVHLERWPGAGSRRLAAFLHEIPGVRRAEANPLTGNVLLLYDPDRTNARVLLHALKGAVDSASTAGPEPTAEPNPPPQPNRDESLQEDCIPLHGLDRDPHLGARVIEQLQKVLGVRVWVNSLTSQVHVAYDRTRIRMEDIRECVDSMQQSHVPGEDRPRHPLDPDPLRDGMNRAVGAVAGIGVLTLQQLIAPQILPAFVTSAAAGMAGVFNLIQGFPVIRDGIRWVLGRRAADIVTTSSGISALTAANIPLGLVVAGLEGFFLAEEVTARRSAYRRYEDSIDTGLSALPGAVIRLEAGTRLPRDAKVIEGFGTAVESGGQQHAVEPGSRVGGGTLMLGGPFVLELAGVEPTPYQPPEARPPTAFESYQRAAVPLALGVAALQVLRTGSFVRI